MLVRYMQQSYVVINEHPHLIELPNADVEILPGVTWGNVEVIGSPAQWFYLVNARRLQGGFIQSRLGTSLKEEIAACLLGGHGIPAAVGVAAFQMLKVNEAFSLDHVTQVMLFDWLSAPLSVNGRSVRYRFANQKAKYLEAALKFVDSNQAPLHTGRALRDWLLQIPGIGLKTASWVARNWLDANDVAILDIHILRAGILGGFYPSNLRVERDYLELEARFLEFSRAIDIPASELDAEIWWQFSNAPSVIHQLFEKGKNMPGRTNPLRQKSSSTNHSHANTFQQPLF